MRELHARDLSISSPQSHVVDPRCAVGAAALGLAATALLNTGPALFLALLALCAVIAFLRIPRRWLRERLGIAAFAIALFALPLPFLVNGPGPSWQLGPFFFSAHGCHLAALLAAKSLTFTLIVLAVLAKYSVEEIAKATQSLGVPGFIARIALLTLRYTWVMRDELGRLRLALRVRAFRNRPNWHSYQIAGNVVGMLVTRGYERAERVELAMRCRAFDGRFRTIRQYHAALTDAYFVAVVVLVCVGLLCLDRLLV